MKTVQATALSVLLAIPSGLATAHGDGYTAAHLLAFAECVEHEAMKTPKGAAQYDQLRMRAEELRQAEQADPVRARPLVKEMINLIVEEPTNAWIHNILRSEECRAEHPDD